MVICRPMHAFSRKQIGIADLKRVLRPVGLTPIFSLMRTMAAEQLTPFDLAIPTIYVPSTDVFTSSDLERAILVRASSEAAQQEPESKRYILDVVLLSRGKTIEDLVQLLSQQLDIELMSHSYSESQLLLNVEKRITATGP